MLIINHKEILNELSKDVDLSDDNIMSILKRAEKLKGLNYDDATTLLKVEDKTLINKIFKSAEYVKDEIYGKRLVLFAPLYVSNVCNNECLYCAFRKSNKTIKRNTLNMEQIKKEAEALIKQGHKRVLLVSGEGLGKKALPYTLDALKAIYSVKNKKGNIRRVNVNIAALDVEDYKKLKKANIGTYQLFQETYHKETYEYMHQKGSKADYNYHLEAMDRAMEAGIDDVGIGVLFGLYDYKYEMLALFQHIKHLENRFGFGPHTISVPRLEPATGSDVASNPPYPLSDIDFKKIIAILRLTIPYTGIILSTRETAETRKEALNLGISQISAGSRSNPGGYSEENQSNEQFSLGDHRSLHEVIEDIVDFGFVPSFCTGCYRLGRVGADFMDLAKPGAIKAHCYPNAIFSFSEYLEDFADSNLRKKGYDLIKNMMKTEIKKEKIREEIKIALDDIQSGKRDVYV